MKKVSQDIDALLLAYLDGELSGSSLEAIQETLRTSKTVKERLHQLQIIQNTLGAPSLESPSVNFTQRVMSNLQQVKAPSTLTPKNGIWLLCGVMVAIGIGVVMVDAGVYNSLNGILALDKLKVPVTLPQTALPSIPFNGKIMVNTIITLNLGLAFLILDRTVLKPLFSRRSKVQL